MWIAGFKTILIKHSLKCVFKRNNTLYNDQRITVIPTAVDHMVLSTDQL